MMLLISSLKYLPNILPEINFFSNMMVSFYTPVMFSGGIESDQWHEMGWYIKQIELEVWFFKTETILEMIILKTI